MNQLTGKSKPSLVRSFKFEYLSTSHPHIRFTVNLRNSSCNNNVFHFNARFDKDQLVRNSNFPSGNWGPEEVSSLPFQPCESFEVEIICLSDCYLVGARHLLLNTRTLFNCIFNDVQVTVNGNYCCEFNHRAPLDQIDLIHVYGDVDISKIKITEQDDPNKLNINDPVVFSFKLYLLFLNSKVVWFVGRSILY